MTLYATDLDGTLLRPDKSISDETAEILNGLVSDGVLFTYATARSFSSASPLLTKLHLNCPAVTFNGVFVIDPRDGRHIVENVFTPFSCKIAIDYFNKMDIAPLVYSYIDGRERVSYLESRLEDVLRLREHKAGRQTSAPGENQGGAFPGHGVLFYASESDY